MKRDMELIIRLAKIIEDRTTDESGLELHIDDVDDALVQYNLGLMRQAGFIKAIDASSSDGEEYLPLSLTWDGHDFLDAARNEVVVSRAKEIAKKQGVELFNLPIQVIKDVLLEGAKSLFT
ncbi:DUF2513 domain-containing protein [Paenibacillus spongiae]|uniref:DUF2513 domain-containing protein n=1 Tax=Paenibacillus spongiae TaxID=2909671 RepID=A0ABY5SHA1_9BACL|nr:DUF2513 domain-containing protein [Paenibacillus spongiae]UVI32065.1 DUF2513 domain-containing protein [Paenibacillus spongiae]